MKRDTLNHLRASTFNDLFHLPDAATSVEDLRINPVTDEDFNEQVVAVAKGVLYRIMTDPETTASTRVDAARELLNRSLGRPVSATITEEGSEIQNRQDLIERVKRFSRRLTAADEARRPDDRD